MSFALPLPTRLNKALCLDITNKAFSDQMTVTDLDSDASALSSGASTYRGEEVESMLGYIDEDATVCAIWPKIQREAAEIEAAQTNRLKRSLTIALQPLGAPFLGQHDVESIRAPVIAPGPESELRQLYGAGSRIEQRFLELH